MNKYFNDFEPTQDSFEPIEEGLYRSQNTGDKIYLVKDGKKYWITSPTVLKTLGYDFGQEKIINNLSTIQSGEPIRMENVDQFKTPLDTQPRTEDKSPSASLSERYGIEASEGGREEIMEGQYTVVPAHKEKGELHVVVQGRVSYILPQVNVELVEILRQFDGEILTVIGEEKLVDKQYGDKLVKDIDSAKRIATGEFVFMLDHVKS